MCVRGIDFASFMQFHIATITACNTADLCTSVTSDGVVIDNSPPTQGTVQDGVELYDVEYQYLRYFLVTNTQLVLIIQG
jgi:hypothetical protein